MYIMMRHTPHAPLFVEVIERLESLFQPVGHSGNSLLYSSNSLLEPLDFSVVLVDAVLAIIRLACGDEIHQSRTLTVCCQQMLG